MLAPLFETPRVEHVPVPDWFRPCDPRWSDPALLVGSYLRNLPHLRKEGVTYFLTFRLNDSLPGEVVSALRAEREGWLRRVDAERRAGELSKATLQAWADLRTRHFLKVETIMDAGHGSCVLRESASRKVVAEALRYFEGVRCRMAAYVVMPNHVHALCHPLPERAIEDLIGSWKKHSADTINRSLGRTGQLWQHETFDRIVRDKMEFQRVVQYIARNPAKARLRNGEADVWLSDEIRAANA
jgi:REP element-mobilizing transposase RayT